MARQPAEAPQKEAVQTRSGRVPGSICTASFREVVELFREIAALLREAMWLFRECGMGRFCQLDG